MTRRADELLRSTHLSYSKLQSYSQCPRRFKLEYLDQCPVQKSREIQLGSLVHAVLADYLRSIQGSPKLCLTSEEDLVARLPQVSHDLRERGELAINFSATDVVEFLTSWIPPEGLMRPTPEGIARVLTKTVEKRPNDFGEVVREIKGLDPTYVRAVLEGFEKALEAGLPIDWKSVLELMETALANPNTSTSPHQRELEDRDPDWDWTRKSSASLLQKAFESEVQIIVDPRRTWKVLDALSWDPDPTPEYEAQFGGDNMDPLTLSLNTTRGRAMHAVLAAAMWAKRNDRHVPEGA